MTYDPNLFLALQEMGVLLFFKPLGLFLALDLVTTVALAYVFPLVGTRLRSK